MSGLNHCTGRPTPRSNPEYDTARLGFQFLRRRHSGRAGSFFIDNAAGKVELREAHAAHTTTFSSTGSKFLSQ